MCRNVTFCDAVWRDARHRTEDVLSVSPWPASHDYGHDRGLEISMTAALDQTTLTDRFVTAFRNHPAGVALVTADPGDGPVAMTATSVCSVDANPPTIAFSASARSSSTPALLRSTQVVVHLLSANQLHLAKLGATSGIDRFADTSLWDRLLTGDIVFRDAAA